MSAGSRRLPCLLLSLPLGLLLAGPARANEGDALRDAKSRLEIEAQRVEKRFKEDRAAAYKLARLTPPRLDEAVDKIYALRAMLQGDAALTDARRELLLVTTRADLDTLRRLAAERRQASGERDDALAREAARDARGLRRDSDSRPGPSAKDRVGEVGSIVGARGKLAGDARDLRNKSGERFVGVLKGIDESAMPIKGDIEFNREHWLRISKRRLADKMTAKERSLLRALNTTLSVDFEKMPLSDVIEYLEKKTGTTITIDKRALDEAGIRYESEINLKLRASTRTVLKRLLADYNLGFIVKDQGIFVTSREQLRQMVTTRTYPIGDLLAVVDQSMGPVYTQLQMVQQLNQLIKLITTTVEPDTWKVNNPEAPGTIQFDPLSMSLIVKQTAEVHFALGSFR